MLSWTQWIDDALNVSQETQTKLIASLFIISLLFLTYLVLLKVYYSKVSDVRLRYRWRKTSIYIAFIIGFALVGRMWLEGIDSLATFLGFIGAGLVVSLKDPIVNLAAWAFILSLTSVRRAGSI